MVVLSSTLRKKSSRLFTQACMDKRKGAGERLAGAGDAAKGVLDVVVQAKQINM